MPNSIWTCPSYTLLLVKLRAAHWETPGSSLARNDWAQPTQNTSMRALCPEAELSLPSRVIKIALNSSARAT
jgi:hypothetical protein